MRKAGRRLAEREDCSRSSADTLSWAPHACSSVPSDDDDSDAAAISPEARSPPDTATCPAASRATPSLSREWKS
ncbi:Hypothetical predicted protein [Cloeon dipterum]|uniref:Uncharacterized protein n=1 Tax=Cloeon dipterum TaxID=197152 RepID=A0A8S1E987_9INSE|nr:Hypothetical predicted protein [Cloeon dipterum]